MLVNDVFCHYLLFYIYVCIYFHVLDVFIYLVSYLERVVCCAFLYVLSISPRLSKRGAVGLCPIYSFEMRAGCVRASDYGWGDTGRKGKEWCRGGCFLFSAVYSLVRVHFVACACAPPAHAGDGVRDGWFSFESSRFVYGVVFACGGCWGLPRIISSIMGFEIYLFRVFFFFGMLIVSSSAESRVIYH